MVIPDKCRVQSQFEVHRETGFKKTKKEKEVVLASI